MGLTHDSLRQERPGGEDYCDAAVPLVILVAWFLRASTPDGSRYLNSGMDDGSPTLMKNLAKACEKCSK